MDFFSRKPIIPSLPPESTIAKCNAHSAYVVMTLGERIKQSREDKGLSQGKLAAIVESKLVDADTKRKRVLQGTVSKWEIDEFTPSSLQLAEIAEACEVDLYWLITGRDRVSAIAPTEEERTTLKMVRALGLTEEQAIQGLSWAATQAATFPTTATRAVATQDDNAIYERQEAERLRREREALRAKSIAKKPDKTL